MYLLPPSRFLLSMMIILSCVTLAANSVSTSAPQVVRESNFDDLISNAEHHFKSFMKEFGKTYANRKERTYRLSVFKSNLRRAKRLQELAGTSDVQYGVTKFSDLTPSEFRRGYLGSNQRLKLPANIKKAPILPTDNLPTHFDWRDHGAVTGVKDQGFGDSSWCYSITGALEGANFLSTGKLVSLSEQQLVGCESPGSIEFDKTSTTDEVVVSPSPTVLSNFSVISADDEQIAANLVENGPLVVPISGENREFQLFRGGAVYDNARCPKGMDHVVSLVGYGSDNGKDYWIVKNSWGTSWGENGFGKVARGKNMCGINGDPTLTIVAPKGR